VEPTVDDIEGIAGLGTWVWVPEGDRLWWSSGLELLLPLGPAGDVGIDALVRCLHPQDQATFRTRVELACKQDEDLLGEYRLQSRDDLRWLQCRARVERDDLGLPRRVVGVFRDITDERRFLDELADAAIRDPLTGLLNRFAISDRLDHALARLLRHERQVAVMFVDLDGLKVINDHLGHERGDDVLRAVSSRLVEAVRREDSVGRYGGDEFVVVCEDISTPDDALVIGERIAARVFLPPDDAGGTVDVTASVGVTAARVGDSPRDVLARADAAMYEAKREGGGRVVYRD
jgi:diguanylate cyclase (GGDEF)-like protein